jgi:hypothetical protein
MLPRIFLDKADGEGIRKSVFAVLHDVSHRVPFTV